MLSSDCSQSVPAVRIRLAPPSSPSVRPAFSGIAICRKDGRWRDRRAAYRSVLRRASALVCLTGEIELQHFEVLHVLDFRSAFVEGIWSSAPDRARPIFWQRFLSARNSWPPLTCDELSTQSWDRCRFGWNAGPHSDIYKVFWIFLDNLNCIIQHRHREFVNLVAVSLKT